ncbi:pyruvate dehydrogenase (acetyl-transferring) E1 component subunit alpha [Amycolatopsis acidicola]|uniref:2-oxoisovalerate dehydrogenase subunit alpha n=1 Tax=Amycolatopsis acidicola TaxID=2596893 RepID=A0A5N0V6B7_9PSEU|nr:thiamine pyrophosphate-dependent enzyme [Amycolatopsis acidicola]KAA9160062.1 pyruvate dehydrogenase (acetyl-transferring) E1 component subunit alpha [Amycolatopsis acidicola]
MTDFTPQFPPEAATAAPWAVLPPLGAGGPARSSLSGNELREACELMLFSRAFDDKGFSLQRQGRFGTFSPVRGQEASVVGAAFALDPGRDWVVPQYRELPALLRQGLPLENFMLTFLGDPRGGAAPVGVNVLPVQIGLAAQLPQAVGLAWGLRLREQSGVVLVFCGDGASSEGDFHEACNLAGTLSAPVVFLVQNNGWAISTPRERQSAAATLAARAPGYGMPGALVDGNDLLAVHETVSAAVERARAGEGPSLIETVTYRMGDHNTADDASRYQPEHELAEWADRDPITRALAYLRDRGLWDDEHDAAVRARIADRIDEAVRTVEAMEPPGVAHLFAHVVEEASPRSVRQQAWLNAAGGAR